MVTTKSKHHLLSRIGEF